MKSTLKVLLIGTLLSVFGMAAVAAPAADPVVGTWTLNAAKSKFDPGPAPKSQTRIYADSAKGMMLTVKTVGADGKENVQTMTFMADGKDYPISGSADYDAVTVKKLNANTIESVQKRKGVAVGSGTRMVSKDGKTLTFRAKGTTVEGKSFDNTSVYDRG